jgi:chromosomal replication initiation ATPase DnaA
MRTTPEQNAARTVIDTLRARDLLDLVNAICRTHGVTLDELCGRQRTKAASWARHETWWQMRHHPDLHFSLADIGRIFGRDHTTVRHGVQIHARRDALRAERPG